MSSESGGDTYRLIGFRLHEGAPPMSPAPITRDWMTATRGGWANRCLPMLIANQSGWVVHNTRAFGAVWLGDETPASVSVRPEPGPEGLLPISHFGYGILTWHIPIVFRTPPGWNLLVRGPANHPKDALYPLEGLVETDWSSAGFTMNWKFTRPLTPVRFEPGEPICMIVPQRRAELEQFVPELRPIESAEGLRLKHEHWRGSRADFMQGDRETASGRPTWQGDYARGRHSDGEAANQDHRMRLHLRPFADRARPDQRLSHGPFAFEAPDG
ncbi:DUF6065 family protein [Nocardia sp. alder85J]|uniref:DUF6065 family protein n=1 Tax=Nocardia sp. alder85J TaxID=2862949 RepID=UPI001CD78C7A|nr:DUF6065 family protein [Nocardia sp. alder85J]MCX4092965.1 DUF6065 family protein [Nocardia sp. alder85J]